LRLGFRKAALEACALIAALSVLASAAPSSAAGASGSPPAPPRIPAAAWILVDAGDGARLGAIDPDRSRSMASTTKLMTAYLALRKLPLGKRLVAPPYHPLPGESLLGLSAGERISVRDLLYGLLLPSGNDAAVTLADGVAGSVPAFVSEMNRAASRLGLGETGYSNPIGLDQPGNYSSPRDLASLTLELRRDPLFRRIVDTARKTLRTGSHPRTVVTRNHLVARVPWVNGVKTGYTPEAGNVLVASGTRKDVTLVSVVMGAPTETARDESTLMLLRYGFSLYRLKTPVRKGERLGTIRVPNADARLGLLAARSVPVTLRRGQRVHVAVHAPRAMAAPIARGDRIGTALVTLDGDPLARVAVLASNGLAPSGSDSVSARVDNVLPGPRAAAWAIIGAAAVAIVIGIALALTHRRRSQGQPGQGGGPP
jgi:serine-type D-Ala-D-Ala carboxypeptidase (penicillin-binding protein 5/6)